MVQRGSRYSRRLLPPLDPVTKQPMGPEKLGAIFPMGLLEQEMSSERFIDIPEEVRMF